MAAIVLDASAPIALFRDEPGADVVADRIGDALISAVNLQEVVKALLRRGIVLDIAREMIAGLHLEVRSHDAQSAFAAAALWPETEKFGSGLGDRSCMALAIAEGLPVLTTDKAWAELTITGLEVRLAR
jgi:PIN domain nuclease of toxin-antitoxin system